MLLHFVLFATASTVAGACLVCAAAGWVLGYQHHALIEWGRQRGRLLRWRQKHRPRHPLRWLAREYRELWRDIEHLLDTGQLRPGR